MEQSSQAHQHQAHAKWRARALPLAGAERQDLEVRAMAYLHSARQLICRPMSLGPELVHAVPDLGVPTQPVSVDEDSSLGWDVVAVDRRGAQGLVWD